MKRLLLLLLLCASSAFAQDLRPSAYLGLPGKITVRGGRILGTSGGVTTIAEQTLTPANSATTYVYIDLSGTPAVATSTSAFPSSSYFPICVVTKDANGVITAFTDSRPDSFMAGGGVSPNSPIPANQAQGPRFNVKNYGAIGDAQHITDGVTAGSSGHTVTSATAQFVAGDVGKNIVCASGSASALMPISQITVRNSATQVTTNGTDTGAASNLKCTWYTANDTAAFQAANAAALPSIASIDINVGATLGTGPGTVYCPEGGYAVNARIFDFVGVGSSIGPGFVGAGKGKCNIYVLPGIIDINDGRAVLMSYYNGTNGVMSGFSVDGLGFGGNNFAHPVIQFNAAQQFKMEDVNITNISGNGAFVATLDFTNSGNGTVSNVFLQGTGGTGTDFACGFSGVSATVFRNLTCSNHNRNGYFANNDSTGVRSVFGGNAPTIIDSTFDECGSASQDCYFFDTKGAANFIGGWVGVGNTNRYAMNLSTATSKVWLNDVNCGQYGSTTNNSGCATLAAGATVYTTASTLRSNGTFGIFNGPSTAFLYDIGGNDWQNCVSATCSAVTAATYATLGFTGGIVPKATVTHTPNTCYAVTGNLLATAQNICTFLNDQNYQILNITAQSGGTTPGNSACATPPVITFSDGTRTATLTMTTAKTQWSSSVDAVTNLNQVFATGTTLTVSIGANTCATPPVNVAVSYVLQSVLNP